MKTLRTVTGASVPAPPHAFAAEPNDGFKRSVLEANGENARGAKMPIARVVVRLKALGYSWESGNVEEVDRIKR